MKTTKKTILQPELLVDDHHGQYMGQLAWQYLADRYKKQAAKVLSAETIKSLENGPEDEWHFEACDSLTNVEFKTETGQKVTIQNAEGGIWAIPACFMRSKAANNFFGS
jgi:hypothetical protein